MESALMTIKQSTGRWPLTKALFPSILVKGQDTLKILISYIKATFRLYCTHSLWPCLIEVSNHALNNLHLMTKIGHYRISTLWINTIASSSIFQETIRGNNGYFYAINFPKSHSASLLTIPDNFANWRSIDRVNILFEKLALKACCIRLNRHIFGVVKSHPATIAT